MSKTGAVIFFILMIVLAFGILAFSSEFFFGRPIDEVIGDMLLVTFGK